MTKRRPSSIPLAGAMPPVPHWLKKKFELQRTTTDRYVSSGWLRTAGRAVDASVAGKWTLQRQCRHARSQRTVGRGDAEARLQRYSRISPQQFLRFASGPAGAT